MPEQLPREPLNLPATTLGGEVEADVLDGEIVDEPTPEPQRPVYVLHQVVQVFQTITIVVRHEHTKTVARHALYVPGGVVALWRGRRRDRRLALDFAHQARAQSDHENGLKWAQHHEAALKARHERWHGRKEIAIDLVKASPWFLAVWVFLMLVTGALLAWAHHSPAYVLWPWKTLAGVVSDLVALAGILFGVACVAVPLGAVAALHELGRRGGDSAPRWARTAAEDDVDVTIDERSVSQALANLRIPQVRDYLKAGHPLQFPVMCRQEGRGTGFEVRLPGIAAEQVIRLRVPVAAGLHRLPKETWLSVGGDASILRGWIADKGALEEGAGEYPLLAEGFCDVFKGGVPFGRSLKGDPKKEPTIGRNSIDGGMPEQGKSNGARVVACGYTLDITTELRIYVPDTNFDFEAFRPRCSRYLMGAEDEVIERMLEEQELLKEELQQRGQLLVDHGVQEVTREIAHAGVGLHPVLALVEEAHVPITHKKYGKDFAQLLGENVKLDRKRGVHIKVSTQAPVRGAMPRDVTTNCTVGVAYALADIYANDAILGPGAHSAGHRATELIPGTDRGIALCKGFEGEARSEMIQAYRVTTDQVPPIVQRALAAMAEQGRAVPGTERGPLAIVSRDLLADLSTVLAHRSGKVRVAALPGMLQNLAKTWGPYRGMKATQLRQLLDDEGVRVTNTGNVPELDVADLARAIAERERVS